MNDNDDSTFDDDEIVTLKAFFDERTMSVHLVEKNPPRAKRGEPGNWELVTLSDRILTYEELDILAEAILTSAEHDNDSFIEIEEEGEVNFIQNKNYISVPSLREVKIPSTSPLQFNDIPLLYEILVKRPDALDCLWSPRIAIEEFEDYIKRKIKKI